MPIRIVCASCQHAFKVAEEAAGRRGKCPKCRAIVTVPAPAKPNDELGIDLVLDEDDAPYALAGQVRKVAGTAGGRASGRSADAPLELTEADAVTTATLTPAQILSAFRDEIERVRPTLLYRFWILVVAGVMLLLPILYLGLIAAVGWAVSYHAMNNTGILENAGGGRKGQAAFLVYALPILAGGFLVAFMIKPLFARSGKARKTRSLDPSREPMLVAFVDGVCSTVGARTPSRIDVDCQVNAAAGFRGGPFAFFNRDLVLTIGLPLAAGLDIRQFAGVLAHEFGHFSQGAGMRLSTMIRSINAWFARVVYERDSWDEHLESWSRGGDVRVMAIVWTFRLAVWLTRRVLWVLMMAGHMVSSVLLRQMEFDADRYEARMVGGETFESTARRLHVLNAAMQGAFYDLSESWREGRLADDLPKLVVANVGQIPPEALEAIDNQVTTGKTGLFDTHPTDRERIFRAHDEDADGVFDLTGPATDVFRDFDSLCRASTFDYYQSIFGKDAVDKENLKPVGEVVRTQTASMAGNQALGRFYQGTFHPLRPLLLPEAAPRAPADPRASRKDLTSARDRMAATVEEHEGALKKGNELRDEAVKVAAARVMLRCDYKPKAAEFGLPKANLAAAEEADREIAGEIETVGATLSIRESAAVRRLHAALSLLEADDVAVPDLDEWREEARVLYPVARHVGRSVLPSIASVVQAQQAMLAILGKWQGDQQNEKLRNAVLRAGRTLAEALAETKGKLGDMIAYPFDHASGIVSLSQYALPSVPAPDDIGALLEAAGTAIDKVIPLHCRMAGRLVLAAEEVEKSLGLDPLPERPREKVEEEAPA